jgi:DNA-binding GntR family transcriptional regulator
MNAAQQAYELLKERIINGQFPHGIRLKESWLAQELGCTRTPIREALIRLENQGLVQTYTNRGAVVNVYSAKDILDLFELREALEVQAIRLAIRRANWEELDGVRQALQAREKVLGEGPYAAPEEDFHHAMILYSKNSAIIEVWNTIRMRLNAARTGAAITSGRYRHSLAEHLAMLDFVEQGDSERAVAMMIDHLAKAKEHYLKWINSAGKDGFTSSG